jgi:hypothetical protein
MTPWIISIGVLYVSGGLLIFMLGMSDEEVYGAPDDSIKWWWIPRAFFFCVFLAPGMCVGLIIWEILKSIFKLLTKRESLK